MNFLMNMDIKISFFIVAFILFLHELEEWNIDEYHKKHYTMGDIVETKLGVRLWLFFLSLIGFIWAFIAYSISNIAVSTLFFFILIDFTTLNGIQHILISIKTKKYNPGIFFGSLFGVVFNILLITKIATMKILPLWLVFTMSLLIIPPLILSIKEMKSKEMPKMLKKIILFSQKLEKFMTQ